MKIPILIPLLFLISTATVQAKNTVPVNYSWNDYDDWYYKKSDAYKGWKYIVIHHSATNAGSVKAFHKFHRRQGYGGIAYHFVIGNGNGMNDGEVKETFRWKQKIAGTHVSVHSWEHNVFGIGICLVGNLEVAPPTKAQLEALKKLISKLKTNYSIANKNIIGHKHVYYDDASNRKEQTACPGNKLNLNKLKDRP
jgi:N-acetyl-anhydromuramyl-L-alanine amidase AmpD